MADIELNEPLKDIQAIVENRPQLSAEEWEIVEKASEWLKASLRPSVRADLEIEYAEREKKHLEELTVASRQQIEEAMRKWKEEQEPLGKEDLQLLLSQEYVSFELPILGIKDKKRRDFTLCEMPQEVEMRFVRILQKAVLPMVERMNAAEWNLNSNWAAILQKTLDSLPEALDAAAELVSICLDPWEEDGEISIEWVKKNVATHRMIKILKAQGECNKYRDLFAKDFQLFRS